MKRPIIVIFFLLYLIASLSIVPEVSAFGSLKSSIQKEIDVNPFLKKIGVKLLVTEEESGYVTIEMYEGHRRVRQRIYKGEEFFEPRANKEIFWVQSGENEKKTIIALRRAINHVKTMKGVKEIMVTAAINTLEDQASDSYTKGFKFYEEKKYREGLKWIRKSADQGNAKAQYSLGVMYVIGEGGVPKDLKEAFKWHRKSADQGNAKAQYGLGAFYEDGMGGVQKNLKEAIKWYRKAAEQGNAEAQSALVRLLQKQ